MDGSAPRNEDIKSKVDDSFLKDIFNQIDKKIYKELLIFLTISLLLAYYPDKQTAPDLLKDIVPSSLPELPTDPVTKKDYQYIPSEDKKSWVLTTVLTSGETFEVAGPNLN